MGNLVDGIVLAFTALAMIGLFVGIVGIVTLNWWLIAALILPLLLGMCWVAGRRWHRGQFPPY